MLKETMPGLSPEDKMREQDLEEEKARFEFKQYRELDSKQMADIQEGQMTHDYLIFSEKENGKFWGQKLEELDEESVGLEGYRGKEIEEIKEAFQNSDTKIFVIIGPSGSSKTERIGLSLSKEPQFGFVYFTKNNETNQKDLQEQAEQNKVVVIDEWNALKGQVELLKETAKKYPDCKFVLISKTGGRKSNQERKKQLEKISETSGLFQNSKTREISVKPCNERQIKEFFDEYLDDLQQKFSIDEAEKQKLKNNWQEITVPLKDKYPLSERVLDNLVIEFFEVSEDHKIITQEIAREEIEYYIEYTILPKYQIQSLEHIKNSLQYEK